MTTMIKLKTGSIYEEQASYSRLVQVENWIYVSNTAGRNPETKLIPEEITEQTLQVFANIESVLTAIDSSLKDVVFSRVYVPNPDDVPAVVAILAEKFKGTNPATTVTCAPLASTIYKVEIEVTAYRNAANLAFQQIKIAS